MTLTDNCIRILKTCNICACSLTMGLCIAISGPTLIDLKYMVKTDLRSTAYIFPLRALGSISGALTAGVVGDMIVQKQISFFISNLLLSIALFGISWSREITTLLIWMTLMGFSVGFIISSIVAYIFELWGKKGARCLQAYDFIFSLGCFVAPLLASPFLGYYNETVSLNESMSIAINETVSLNESMSIAINETVSQNLTEIDFNIANKDEDISIPTITFAYMSIGIYTLLVTFFYFVMWIIAPTEKNEQKREAQDSEKGKFAKTCLITLLLIIFVIAIHGVDVGYSQLLTTYALKGSLNLSTRTGSYMTSAFFAAFIISEFSAIFLANKVKSLNLMIFYFLITFLGSLTLLFLSEQYELALWLSSILLGYGLGPLFPSCFSWISRYITITSKISSLICAAFSTGSMLVPYAISYYIEETPQAFLYANVINFSIAVGVTLFIYLIVRRMPDKYAVQEKFAKSICDSETNL